MSACCANDSTAAQPVRTGTSTSLQRVFKGVSIGLALVVGLVLAEGTLRLKNMAMNNYDIEMWRYSKTLKTASSNPVLGHEHLANASAVLQSVEIRLNEWGMRGEPVAPKAPERRRILLLGSSITLGWGVPEDETLAVRLRRMFEKNGQAVEVLNAGIGNYNARRYVELFLTRLHELEPSDVVVHYFLNDAEVLPPGGGNWLLANSQLAATLWVTWQQQTNQTGEVGLIEHYRSVYAPDAPGYAAMQDALQRLGQYATEHNIRLYLAMVPDVHNLTDYPFGEIHRTMEQLTRDDGYRYIDLYPGFEGLRPETVWAMPGDPHPNGLGHQIMAETLYPVLADVGSNDVSQLTAAQSASGRP